MTCDACKPKARGYTVYFSESRDVKRLASYFSERSEQSWMLLNEKMFWVNETVFFDLIDYLEAHMETGSVFAVLSNFLDPLKNLNTMKLINEFKEEREASWIDMLIENNSIRTQYQPIVYFENGELNVMGHELLSRGIDAGGGIIPPNKMFEAARIRNRIFSLDKACRLQSVRNASAIKDKMIFINFIPTAIYVPEHCLATTFKLIKEMNIKPVQVVFEVVETDEVTDLEHLKKILNYYRSHGFKYALDDVGVGYNDLKKLTQMEPDYVKLAMEFANGVSGDRNKQKVAKSVMDIAHNLGALALAEGVEFEEDLMFLSEMGYDLFQGYFISKPQDQPMNKIDKSISILSK
jgi:EAL domain-containing protein (putative c-di-GMP-specific phosphodiesterase class I)